MCGSYDYGDSKYGNTAVMDRPEPVAAVTPEPAAQPNIYGGDTVLMAEETVAHTVLLDSDIEKALSQIGPLGEDDKEKAINLLNTLAMHHAMFENWMRGNVVVGFDTDKSDLTLAITPEGKQQVECFSALTKFSNLLNDVLGEDALAF